MPGFQDILFIQTVSFALLSKIRKTTGNQIFPVQRAMSQRLMEVKRIRFELKLVVEKIGFRGFVSTRDTHTEHVFTGGGKITVGISNSLMVFTFYSSLKD